MCRKVKEVALWLYAFLFVVGMISHTNAALTPEMEELIRRWSPLVWLHSGEIFLPSTVEFFLPEVTVKDNQSVTIQEFVTPENLIGGEISSIYHMQTRVPLDCPACYNLDVFFGQSIENGGVPVYTIYREYDDEFNTLDVSYFTFYPYNRGKEACVGIPVDGECVGATEIFGNHVGDWERNVMRFRNGEPYMIYLSVHSFGAFYTWNETTNNFQFLLGEEVRSMPDFGSDSWRVGDERYTPKYPPTVELVGTHPVVFSANGSHGLWASAGVHTYVPGLPLQDFTDEGIAWNTWDNLILIPWQSSNISYEGELNWLNYLGDWGNSEDGCGYEIITGECILSSGPSGPITKNDGFPEIV